MYNDSITVFNYHASDKKWYLTVLHGVHSECFLSTTKTTRGDSNGNSAFVIIRCDKSKKVIDRGVELQFVSPKEYRSLEYVDNTFTFSAGKDFFYIGEWDDLEPIPDSEFECGIFNELNDEYDGIYLVNSCEYVGLMPHLEVGGR